MTAPVDLSQEVADLAPAVVAHRRELHRRPELAFAEVWTDLS